MARGSPVIGHCLGGQFLAKALGGEVTDNDCWEVGWGEVESALRGPKPLRVDFMQALYGNQPLRWEPGLAGHDRLRFIVNALTRIRFVADDGTMDFAVKEGAAAAPPGSPVEGTNWLVGASATGASRSTAFFDFGPTTSSRPSTLEARTASTSAFAASSGVVKDFCITALAALAFAGAFVSCASAPSVAT